jgi:Tol biopolymer transport system component
MRLFRVIAATTALLAFGALEPRAAETQRSSTGAAVLGSWTATQFQARGGRVAWYHGDAHELIAYDAVVDELTRGTEVFVVRPNGAGRRCVTCDATIPKGFVGQPAWHPDGRHLVVQAESPHARHRFLNHLAWGIDNDLWLVDLTTGTAEKIWSTPRRHAALHPHFSRDGSRLMFAERTPTGRSFRRIRRLDLGADGENHWDGWRIRIVEFHMRRSPAATITASRILFADRGGFFETHGFRSDGRIVYSHTPGGRAYVDAVYLANDDGSGELALVDLAGTWNEHGQFAPSGRSLAFISSRADPGWRAPRSKASELRTELFLQRGSEITQLTSFNRSGARRRLLVSDFDWDRDGRRIVFQVAPIDAQGKPESPQLWMLTFSEAQ